MDDMLIISVIVLFAFIGGAIGWCNAEKHHIIMGIIGTLIASALPIFTYKMVESNCQFKQELWNGGYCPHCGEHWELGGVYESTSASHTKTKIYYCPKCHTEIEQ